MLLSVTEGLPAASPGLIWIERVLFTIPDTDAERPDARR